MRRRERIRKLRKDLEGRVEEVLATSSQSRDGLDDLWKQIYARVEG
jgi:hypothetical protein